MTEAYEAASLSLSQGRWRDAEKAAAGALADDDITDADADALRELMREIHFRQYLDTKGQVLTAAEVRLTVSGPGIEPGAAPITAIYGRARHVGQLVNLLAKPAQYDLIASPPQVEVDNGGCAITLRFAKTADAAEPPLAELTAILRNPPPDADDRLRKTLQAIGPDGRVASRVTITAIVNGQLHTATLTATHRK